MEPIVPLEVKSFRITLFSFLWTCMRYYFRSKKLEQGLAYFTVSVHGVPQVSVMIAHGRKAWECSQFAADYFASRK